MCRKGCWLKSDVDDEVLAGERNEQESRGITQIDRLRFKPTGLDVLRLRLCARFAKSCFVRNLVHSFGYPVEKNAAPKIQMKY